MHRRDILRLLPLIPTGTLAFATGAGETAHPDAAPQADPGKPLALQYIDRVVEMLRWIRDNQAGRLMEVAWRIARTVQNGGRCWSAWDMGHNTHYDLFPDRNGAPELFTVGYDPAEPKAGDLLLVSTSGGNLAELRERGVYIVGGSSPYSYDSKGDQPLREDLWDAVIRRHSDLWIETNITR